LEKSREDPSIASGSFVIVTELERD
jgi:hypothetical protein